MQRSHPLGRLIALPDAERRRLLTALALAAVVAVVLIKVVFASTSQPFRGGAALADAFAELCLAYIASFIFYELVVDLPEVRKRRLIYRSIAPFIDAVLESCRASLREIARQNNTAFTNADHLVGWDTLAQWCANVAVVLETDTYDLAGNPMTAYGQLRAMANESRYALRRLLDFMPHLDVELIQLLSRMELCHYFKMFDPAHQLIAEAVGNFSIIGQPLFEYRDHCYLLADAVAPFLHGDLASVRDFGRVERATYLESHPTSGGQPPTIGVFKIGPR